MIINYHPTTIIEIYPDGRVEMFFAEPLRLLDKLKLRLIENTIRNSQEKLMQRFSPGTYRFYMTNYNLIKQKTKFALKPM